MPRAEMMGTRRCVNHEEMAAICELAEQVRSLSDEDEAAAQPSLRVGSLSSLCTMIADGEERLLLSIEADVEMLIGAL